MKVLTLGAGFVADHLPYEKLLKNNERLHSHEEDNIEYLIIRGKPDVIINCIGKTGRPNVDWCESNKIETYTSNVVLPLIVADICERHSIKLINIGSGCIYFGFSPYKGETSYSLDPGWREDDFANPESFYSKTKYACDLMLGPMPHVTTLRIRMPLSTQNNPRNLINKLKGYSKVIDIPNSVTFMDDLVRCVDWAVNKVPGGIFHVVNPQPLTAAQIMCEYQKYVPDHKFEIINEQELDQLTIAKRSNCILSTEKLQSAGFNMTDSQEALEICMKKYIENIRRENV